MTTKADPPTLNHLLSIMATQSARIDALNAELFIQFKRMAQIQAELDALPHADKRRRMERARLPLLASRTNVNGRAGH